MRGVSYKFAVAIGAGLLAAGCQSSETRTTQPLAAAPAPAATQAAAASAPAGAAAQTELAFAGQPPAAPAQCAIQVAGGPPPKPAHGADFGSAVVKETGNAVGRGAMQVIGGLVGGGIGAAVGGGLAQSTIRAEADIKGVWTISDGRPDCGCQIGIDSLFKLKGKGADSGPVKQKGCSDPRLAAAAQWALGHSFTGYDAKFELKAADKKTVLATLNRDGMHYFSGTFADGTPLVMWREGQTYHQLASFK